MKRSVLLTLSLFLSFVLMTGMGTAQEKLKLALVVEQTGAAAGLGDYWIKAFKLATEEINGAGGVLGRRIEYEIFDTQSKPPISVSALKKALAWGPISTHGPIYSSSALANMALSQEAKTPQFMGAENWRISTLGNKFVFRTSTQQAIEMPKLLSWIMAEKKPKKIAAIYVNNDYGMGGLEAAKKYLKEKWNTEFVFSGATEQKQADYTAELNHIKRVDADAILAYLLEEESAMFNRQVKKMGMKVLVFGPNSSISEDTCRLGKEDVDGIYGMSSFEYTSPDPNCERLAKYYKDKYGEYPDNEFMKGYNSIYLVKTAIELTKSFDREKIAEKLHNLFITPKMQPNIAGGNLYYDENGDLHCWDYLTQIVWNGQRAAPKIIAAVPPMKGPDSDKKTIWYAK